MNNNNKKKSEGLWINRLFRQAGMNMAVFKSKTYFVHRFPKGNSAQDDNPFHTLFTGEGNNLLNFEVNGTGFQQLFEHEFSLSTDKTDLIEPTLSYHRILFDAAEGNRCDNHATLETKYLVFNYHNETLDTKTFRLSRLDGQHFNYLPGQYVIISVEIKGQAYKRSYSLASTPTRPGNIEITVKRDPNGGVVSNWLNDNLKEGDTLTIKGPFGNFTCAKVVPDKILFLAAGSGIVPIMSMLRWLTDTHGRTDVVLVMSCKAQSDIIFGDELKLIAARHNNIKITITLTKEPLNYSNWAGLSGRVNEKMIVNCVPDVRERLVYLCGPDSFMLENKQHLQNLGVPAGQLQFESYTVNTSKAPEQAKPQPAIIGRSSKNQTGNYRVRFAKSGKTMTANGAVNLLDLAQESGVAISHECRVGNCGECMVKCLKGNIEMTGQAEIADIDRRKGWVYACCAYPVSNVVLDL